mmetsp:Transcript_28006/g.61300  ORF Transcript_28006/g.61300 Transcript_28006/m.61300 type:complete len:353 (+) Transcript_28006:820-1878(+)
MGSGAHDMPGRLAFHDRPRLCSGGGAVQGGVLHAAHVLPRAAVRGDQPARALLHRPDGARCAVGPQARDAARNGGLPALPQPQLRGGPAPPQELPRRRLHVAHRGPPPAAGADAQRPRRVPRRAAALRTVGRRRAGGGHCRIRGRVCVPRLLHGHLCEGPALRRARSHEDCGRLASQSRVHHLVLGVQGGVHGDVRHLRGADVSAGGVPHAVGGGGAAPPGRPPGGGALRARDGARQAEGVRRRGRRCGICTAGSSCARWPRAVRMWAAARAHTATCVRACTRGRSCCDKLDLSTVSVVHCGSSCAIRAFRISHCVCRAVHTARAAESLLLCRVIVHRTRTALISHVTGSPF